MVKIQQRRSVIFEFLQEVDRNISDTKVIPVFKRKTSTQVYQIPFIISNSVVVSQQVILKNVNKIIDNHLNNLTVPPLSFHMMALVALLYLSDSQIWMEPVKLF